MSVRINANDFPLPEGPMCNEFAGKARKGGLGCLTVGPSPACRGFTSGIGPFMLQCVYLATEGKCRAHVGPRFRSRSRVWKHRSCKRRPDRSTVNGFLRRCRRSERNRCMRALGAREPPHPSVLKSLRKFLLENLHGRVSNLDHGVSLGYELTTGGQMRGSGAKAGHVELNLADVGYVLARI